MQIIRSIQNRIYEVRGERVMLDRDLAALSETETKALNLALKRNNKQTPLRLRNETSKRGGSRYLPHVFTEQGIAMLSSILNSDKAIQMNIAIMRAFVEIRRIVLQQGDTRDQLRQIQQRINEHDVQLSSIYDVPIASIGKICWVKKLGNETGRPGAHWF